MSSDFTSFPLFKMILVLQPYKDVVGTIAAVCTIANFFAPAFMCKKIISQKSTQNVDSTPFVGGISMSLLMLKYGLIINDPAMIPVNIAGVLLNIIYLSIYYLYSDDKMAVFKSLGKAAVFTAVILGYAQIESEERIEYNYGLIITVIMLALIGSPLLSLKEIIATKSSATLPFPLILGGSVVTSLWFVYGVLIKNEFMVFQNVVAMALALVQLMLCLIYPSEPSQPSKSKRKKQ